MAPARPGDAAFALNRALARVERIRRPGELRRIARAFEDLAVLEIGGPSRVFGRRGLLPVYPRLRSCDLADYAATTLWDARPPPPPAVGRQFVAEATDLGVADESYEGLLASHVLEHVANPLGALREWTRVVAAGGPLLVVVPQRDRTFDHRRPVTPLAHLVADDRASVGEDDATHLDEVLALHDLRRDPLAGDRAAFERRCRDNERNRGMHHHVFDTPAAVELVEHAGLEVDVVCARRPHHIVVLARVPA